jgi:hypothetical protein
LLHRVGSEWNLPQLIHLIGLNLKEPSSTLANPRPSGNVFLGYAHPFPGVCGSHFTYSENKDIILLSFWRAAQICFSISSLCVSINKCSNKTDD